MSLVAEKGESVEIRQEAKKKTRKGVFWPAFLIVGGGAVLGIVNNKMLTEITMNGFLGSLRGLGWLYQIISLVALAIVVIVTFSKNREYSFGRGRCETQISVCCLVCDGIDWRNRNRRHYVWSE